jgi:pimeloyl-ACP methyl ester carboxylesterase
VRAALGEGKLNFLGLSYGSQLGAAYAELYPDNIRVMALDGALDHAQQASSMLADEALTKMPSADLPAGVRKNWTVR